MLVVFQDLEEEEKKKGTEVNKMESKVKKILGNGERGQTPSPP